MSWLSIADSIPNSSILSPHFRENRFMASMFSALLSQPSCSPMEIYDPSASPKYRERMKSTSCERAPMAISSMRIGASIFFSQRWLYNRLADIRRLNEGEVFDQFRLHDFKLFVELFRTFEIFVIQSLVIFVFNIDPAFRFDRLADFLEKDAMLLEIAEGRV